MDKNVFENWKFEKLLFSGMFFFKEIFSFRFLQILNLFFFAIVCFVQTFFKFLIFKNLIYVRAIR